VGRTLDAKTRSEPIEKNNMVNVYGKLKCCCPWYHEDEMEEEMT